MGYPHWERPQLLQELHNVQTEYENWKKQKLNLNMARGKPGLEQLALSRELFTILDFDSCVDQGVDA